MAVVLNYAAVSRITAMLGTLIFSCGFPNLPRHGTSDYVTVYPVLVSVPRQVGGVSFVKENKAAMRRANRIIVRTHNGFCEPFQSEEMKF